MDPDDYDSLPHDLRSVVDSTWMSDLEKGFSGGGNPFFAWIAIASLPKKDWPDWAIEYLVEVADRVLKFDSEKAPAVLGIKGPKKSWLKAAPLIREWEERKENPKTADLARYWGVLDQDIEILGLQDELMMYMEVANEEGITRLEAREKVAAQRGYSSESSHRRGVNRRIKRSQE